MQLMEHVWHLRIQSGRCLYTKVNRQLPEFIRQRGVLFIHIPKTAGISLTNALYGREVGHKKLTDHLQVNRIQTDQLFTFSVVRNPWDRLVSAYTYLKQGGEFSSASDRLFSHTVLWKYDTFEKFVNNWLSVGAANSYFHFEPQYGYLIDGSGKLAVNKLLRFENLSADLEGIHTELGEPIRLTNTNRSERSNYKNYYDNGMIQKVASVYEQDIDSLGYSFD